jgi:signal transduction histidine kinase
MPAIEPARLSREVQAVTLAFDRPAELVDRVLALFDFYADRVLRPGAYASMRAPQRSFSAPLPVINSLRQALGREAAARPELAWDIADALWSVGYHESYLLAAAVLEPQTGARVAAWVEERLRGGLEVRLSRLLATSAWRGWRAADPQGFLTLVEAWVQGKDAARQGFAYLALQAAAAEAPTNRLAPLIDLLYRLPSPRTAAVQQSRRDLLRGLAERSPAEVAAYLLHEHARAAPGSDRDLRLLLGLFPPELRERLRLALRG